MDATEINDLTVSKAKELPPLISSEAAAELLAVTPRTVRNLCARGELRGVHVGRVWRVNSASLLEFAGLA